LEGKGAISRCLEFDARPLSRGGYLVVFVHYLGVSVHYCVVFVYCLLVSVHYLKVKPLFSTAQAELSVVESMCLALFLQYCARRNIGWFHCSLRESVALCSVLRQTFAASLRPSLPVLLATKPIKRS